MPEPEGGKELAGHANRVAGMGMPGRRSRGGAVAEAAAGRSVPGNSGIHPTFSVPQYSHTWPTPPTQRQLRDDAGSRACPPSHTSAHRGRLHWRWTKSPPSTASFVLCVSGAQHGVMCTELHERRFCFWGLGDVCGRGGVGFRVVMCWQSMSSPRSRLVTPARV